MTKLNKTLSMLKKHIALAITISFAKLFAEVFNALS